MQNLHDDKNLDRLSREAADEFEPDLSLHSWERLKAGLDKELPEQKERKRRLLFILFFFLLLGGGIVVSAVLLNRHEAGQQAAIPASSDRDANRNSTSNSSGNPETTGSKSTISNDETKDNSTVAPVTADRQPTLPNTSETTQSQNPITDNTSTANVPTDPSTGDSKITLEVTKTPLAVDRSEKTITKTNKPEKNLVEKKEAGPQGNLFAIAPAKKPGTEKRSNGQKNKLSGSDTDDKKKREATVITTPTVTKDADASQKEQQAVVTKQQTSDKQPADTNDKADEANTDSAITHNNTTAPQLEKPATAQPLANETKEQPGAAKLKTASQGPSVAAGRWEFGASYAPDVSTVKFTHTQKPGLNLGVSIGYNLSRRFSIQTGAFYTIKNYKSRGEDYHPPKGYWTDYVKIETVAADCNMWDIPINLRYNLVPRHRTNLFVTTGLSSYIMRKEDYDFFYYYNGNPVNRYRSYETDSKHWLSVLNFSVGYERQVSKNFSLQAEPFFKQPLKGVGFGNVKLNSTGIFFSVKYKPVARSSK